MAKYRVWTGDDPESEDVEILKTTSSLADAIKFIRKREDELDESNSGLQFYDGFWDEWLDDDDQNIHEHLYMYGGKSRFLRDIEDEDEDDDFDDDEEEVEDDLDDRLMDVIGGGRSTGGQQEEAAMDDAEDEFDDDDDDDFDDEEDEEEDED